MDLNFNVEEHWVDDVSKRLFPVIFILFNIGFWWHVRVTKDEQLQKPLEMGYQEVISDIFIT